MIRRNIVLGFFALLLNQANPLMAQMELPQNIYRVTVNSRYVIENHSRTSKFYAIGQLISDSLGRLHREIDYDWETHIPKHYRWNYFNGLQKVRTEFYMDEELQAIKDWSYNSDSSLNSISLFTTQWGDTLLSVKEVYAYNPNGTLKEARGYNARGKRRYKTKYKFDEQGNEVYRKIRGKKLLPPDSITFLQKSIEYDSLNRISTKTIHKTVAHKKEVTRTYAYTYNEKGLVTQKVTMDSHGTVMSREKYTYRRDDRIHLMEVLDGNDNLVDYQAWRYEIYKTADRRHRVLE